MALRAKPPEAVTKRLKLFLYGASGTGKTSAAIQMPRPYIIDTEKGTENYDQLIRKSGGVVLHTTDIHDLINEVKALLTETHDFRTLVVDPITTVYQDLLDKCEAKVGSDFGRHYGAANKEMKRLVNLIMQLDMNVVMTSHAKAEYGPKLEKIGQTFDSWKRLEYIFDLVLELNKQGKGRGSKRVATVTKTRIETFPDGDTFEMSYDAIRERYDAATLEREAKAVSLATAAQVAEMRQLLDVVKLPEDTTEKWFAKANVETWDDMPAETIAKCIDYVKARLPGGKAA
jgi:hypothetical protein